MIGEPPVEAGANHDKVTEEFPEVPVTLLGAEGTVASAPARTETETAEADEPAALVATMVKLYATPETSPVNSQDVSEVVHIASVVDSSPSDAVTV